MPKILKKPILVKKDDGTVSLRVGKGEYVDVEKPQGSGSSGSGGQVAAPRVMAAADNGLTFNFNASQSLTFGAGLGSGFNVRFVNTSASAQTITVIGAGGVTINGAANGTVRRSVPANGVLHIQATAANAINVPRVGSLDRRLLDTNRALGDADITVVLELTANRSVTISNDVVDGFNVQFINASATAVTITVTPQNGVTVNGGTAAVARTIQPWQTTALMPRVGANAYTLPGA